MIHEALLSPRYLLSIGFPWEHAEVQSTNAVRIPPLGRHEPKALFEQRSMSRIAVCIRQDVLYRLWGFRASAGVPVFKPPS